jgi:hypothetical protein
LGCALLALVGVVLYGCGARAEPLTLCGALALAVAFGPITSDLALGQFALVAFLGAALVALLASRSITAAAAAACVAFAQPNVGVGLLAQLARKGVAVAIALGALITYAVGVIFAGFAWPLAYARALNAHGFAERFAAIQFTPMAILYGLRASPTAAVLVDALCFAVALCLLVPLTRRVNDAFARFAAFSALAPFVASFFHEHDFVAAYAAAVWCALRTAGTARVLGLAGTLLVAVDWLGLGQRPTGIAQSALLAFAAFAAYVALGERAELPAAVRFLLGFAVLFAAGAWFGAHHPVPVWPDALGAFHADPSASAATVWSAEQRETGLLAVQPVWATLRLLSLLGCALLGYSIYRHSSCCRTA